VPPPCSANGTPVERRPSPEPSFANLSKYPVTKPPSRFSSQNPIRQRGSVSRAFFYLSLKVPGEEDPAPSSPSGALWGELPVTRAFFYMSLYPKRLGAPFCSRAVCKPDKPLDIRRSLWTAATKANAPFREPMAPSCIHITRSPHSRSSPTTHGERNRATGHGGCIHCLATWFLKGIVKTLLLTTPVHAAFGKIPSILPWVGECVRKTMLGELLNVIQPLRFSIRADNFDDQFA
jgi:hypothetical protein